MDVNKTWTAQQWMNRGAELLARDPCLAQRLLVRLQLDQKKRLARSTSGSAYLAPRSGRRPGLPTMLGIAKNQRNRTVGTKQPRSRFAAAGAWQKDGSSTHFDSSANQAIIPRLQRPLGPAIRDP